MDINLFDEALNGLKAKGICGTKWAGIYTALRFDCRPFTSVVEINCLFEIPYISGQEFRKSHLFPFACCVFCLGTRVLKIYATDLFNQQPLAFHGSEYCK